MQLTKRPNDPLGSSFLPEDYLQRKADRRAGLITLCLFTVVMFGVVGAFFVTNRQRSQIESLQEQINREYAAEARKIDQLKVLEQQKGEMLEKADITTALIERVPRSILLAELINRMPTELTLTELNLVSTRVKDPAPKKSDEKTKSGARSIAGKGKSGDKAAAAKAASARSKTEPAAEEPPKPTPPKFTFRLQLVGLSLDDADVADYQAALKDCPLLANVDLIFSGEEIVDDVALRKFRIEADIKTNADARHMEPLAVPRLNGRPDLATEPGSAPPLQAWLAGFKGVFNGTDPQPKQDAVTGVDEQKEH